MLGAKCGCDAVRRAAETTDPDEIHARAVGGADARNAWRCPYAGYPEPADDAPAAHLSRAHRAALADVERVTGFPAACAKTCPVWYAGRPWVHRAAEVYEWREKHATQLVALRVTRPLAGALSAIDAAVNARAKADAKRAREHSGGT